MLRTFMRNLTSVQAASAGPTRQSFPDIGAEDLQHLRAVDAFTMTSIERRFHLLSAVRHVKRRKIPGALVECGVWRGGSMMLVAQELRRLGDVSRDLVLFDTFAGMPPPDAVDVDAAGRSAERRLAEDADRKDESKVWAVASRSDVEANLATTGYPTERLHFVEGMVEETIPARAPAEIALLRLDTDWYESTRHELEHLWPRLVRGGVLIIDDYGYWQGARKAVDEYFASSQEPVLLHRIDDTGRGAVKP